MQPGSHEEAIIGEFQRTLDDRYRLALPPEVAQFLGSDATDAVLVKERDRCLSLWKPETWNQHFEKFANNLKRQIADDIYESRRIPDVQRAARLLSARYRRIQIGQRSRLLIPEGFREFLSVAANGEVAIIGAGVCVEIWHPEAWLAYLKTDLEFFNESFRNIAAG
jgi:MraZ protein